MHENKNKDDPVSHGPYVSIHMGAGAGPMTTPVPVSTNGHKRLEGQELSAMNLKGETANSKERRSDE